MTVCDAPNRPHLCEYCDSRYKRKQALVLHYVQSHHLSSEVAREKAYPNLIGIPDPDWLSNEFRDEQKRKKRRAK